MSNQKRIAENLDLGLSRIQAKVASIEESLKGLPGDVQGLESLLRLAVQTQIALEPSRPSEAFCGALETRLLNLTRARGRQTKTVRRRRIRYARWIWRPAAAALLIVMALLIGSIGVAYASADALPGDLLYGVKRGVEEARLALTLSPTADATLLLTFANRRIEEAEASFALGRGAAASKALESYAETAGRFAALAASSSLKGSDQALRGWEAALERHQAALSAVLEAAPEAVKVGLDQAIESAKHSQEVLEVMQAGGSPSELAPGQLKKESEDTSSDQQKGKPK